MQPTTDVLRERTITWEDPGALAAAAVGRAGLEFLQAMADGELPHPPVASLMDYGIREVSEGRVVFTGEAGEHLMNPIGSVHGGVIATLLDSAMGCAVHTTLPAGVGYTTLEIKVNYVRAALPTSGTLVTEGVVVHRGRTVATAEGRVVAEATGKLIAHATTTCLVVS